MTINIDFTTVIYDKKL